MALQRTQSLTTTKIPKDNAAGHIGMKGELTVTQDGDDIKLYLHDGVTLGGHAILAHKVEDWAAAQAAADLRSGGPITAIPGVEYLVIAGGGGGGGDGHTTGGAGGGAGGYRSSVQGESSGGNSTVESTLTISKDETYSIVIGAGGTGSTSRSNNGSDGQPSVFGSITALGGGRASHYQNVGGYDGGSGGGGNYNGAGGSGEANQGHAGGVGQGAGVGTGNRIGGGGGGAGGVGGNSGNGGIGISSLITGTSIERAGGGGGGTWAGGTAGTTTGGGGNGGSPTNQNVNGFSATQNTGGGGGGGTVGGSDYDSANGGDGGSGIVIIAYPIAFPELTVDGFALDSTYTYSDSSRSGYRVYQFLSGSGSISFS